MTTRWLWAAWLLMVGCSDSAADGDDESAAVDASATGGQGGSAGNAGTGGSDAGGTGDAGLDAGLVPTDAGPSGTRPHPLYPALDLDALPGNGGAASGAYTPPNLPVVTRSMNVTGTGAQARDALLAACQTSGTEVFVPDGAGRLGVVDFGNVSDCDVRLGPQVIADLIYVGHLPGPQVAPAHRVRIRGGQLGSIMVDPGSTDIVFDSVTVNSGVVPAAQRPGVAIYLIDDGATGVERFAVVNSVIRMLPTEPDGQGNRDGSGYLAARARDVFFANNNIVTAGNRNSWGFRIGGGDNFIIVDSVVRVSFHKLIRMNDGPVDYVYVKGGTWLREDTLTADGSALNDAFAQLGDLGTDHVYIHDTSVWLRSPEPVSFGAWHGPGQVGKSWEARRIAWHARADTVISDTHLGNAQAGCVSGATCDYGVGTHSYTYDADLSFPVSPWRSLPNLAEHDPDQLPTNP